MRCHSLPSSVTTSSRLATGTGCGSFLAFFAASVVCVQATRRSGCTTSVNTATLRPSASSGRLIAAMGASRTASHAPAATAVPTIHPARAIVSAARYQSGLTGLMACLLGVLRRRYRRSERGLVELHDVESSMFSAIARSPASCGRTLRAKNDAAATLPS